MKKFLLILLVLISFPLAYGHPYVIDTVPKEASNAPVGISEIVVTYSEAIEIDFSTLKVYDNNGEQIDNKDTRYFEGEDALVVTTPPLDDGIYTVTSKVLSRVDGHLVDYAFVFAIGETIIDPTLLDKTQRSDTIFYPEAASRFPGLVGQTIVLGAVIASLLIWGTQNKNIISEKLEKFHSSYHGKFMTITGVGLVAVFVSNILMLAVQTFRLETSAFAALETSFGTTWIIRMSITVILLGIWFVMEKRQKLTSKSHIPLLVLSLMLISTSTLVGHGTASEQFGAIILDYIHNLVAAIWIGGIIFYAFILLPSFSSLENKQKELLTLATIPRFSIVFVIAVGIVIITGPMLLWFLESDIELLTESTYGKLIIAKILIASVMVALGGFFQFRLQKKAEADLSSGNIAIYKKLKRSLKIDVTLGIILLGVVALLVNGTLPAGEIQKVEANQVTYDFSTTAFSENMKFDLDISPFITGSNIIKIRAVDLNGNIISDLENIKVKILNPQRSIVPIEITTEKIDETGLYQGEIVFGFSGIWKIEIEAQRTENANEAVSLDLVIKPRLPDLKINVKEFEFPLDARPLYPLFDGKNSLWISDASAPRLWQFFLDAQEFRSFEFDGNATMWLTMDNDGKIWFTDTPRQQIGFIDPDTEDITTISLPESQPVIYDSVPTFLQADDDGNVWITITNKDMFLKYDQAKGIFEEHKLPDREVLPFALARDDKGMIWFTESATGRIGFINPETSEIKEFIPETPLESPEALLFDKEGNLWIAEHTGVSISRFNPILETFVKIPLRNSEALPYGMTLDRYNNIWIGQHTVDSIAAYDPHNGNLIEVPIETSTSFIQFMTSDDKNNVWFVEQRGNKLGTITLTEVPISPIINKSEINLRYSEIVAPMMALGIIATSVFFVKGIRDKRRINALIMS